MFFFFLHKTTLGLDVLHENSIKTILGLRVQGGNIVKTIWSCRTKTMLKHAMKKLLQHGFCLTKPGQAMSHQPSCKWLVCEGWPISQHKDTRQNPLLCIVDLCGFVGW